MKFGMNVKNISKHCKKCGRIMGRTKHLCPKKGSMIRASIKKRFTQKVLKTNKCWLWKGAIDGMGYGKMMVGCRTDNTHGLKSAHRISYELFKGTLPNGMRVLHHCDTPTCVNPKHLYAGTQRDNVRDAVVRGRFGLLRYGQETIDKIRALYSSGMRMIDIAKKCSVSYKYVHHVTHSKNARQLRIKSGHGEHLK